MVLGFGSVRTVFNSILVVCLGNVCRSPVAEFLFRHELGERDIRVSSAGLGALVGRPMDDNAIALLQSRGIDASEHRARQLEPSMLREADLILAMEQRHLNSVARLAPEASGKVFLFDKWHAGGDVPDPYRRSRRVFEQVHASIERGVGSWLRYL
jgi:protein-tyrosine phosphatase